MQNIFREKKIKFSIEKFDFTHRCILTDQLWLRCSPLWLAEEFCIMDCINCSIFSRFCEISEKSATVRKSLEAAKQ